MTLYALTHALSVFKCGVAGAPVWERSPDRDSRRHTDRDLEIAPTAPAKQAPEPATMPHQGLIFGG